jgi:hypothetical protein
VACCLIRRIRWRGCRAFQPQEDGRYCSAMGIAFHSDFLLDLLHLLLHTSMHVHTHSSAPSQHNHICSHLLVCAMTSMDMHAPPARERCLATLGNREILTSPQIGRTALFMAARGGHVEASRLLLENKADVNAADWVRCGEWSQSMCGLLTIPSIYTLLFVRSHN